jgi:hypothetical protein
MYASALDQAFIGTAALRLRCTLLLRPARS